MDNIPIWFGQDNSDRPASSLNNSITIQAFQAQHFSWILHGITNCHFQSSTKVNNIPFHVEAICEQNICSRAIAQKYFKCKNIFENCSQFVHHIKTLTSRVHGYYTSCPNSNESSRQTYLGIQAEKVIYRWPRRRAPNSFGRPFCLSQFCNMWCDNFLVGCFAEIFTDLSSF